MNLSVVKQMEQFIEDYDNNQNRNVSTELNDFVRKCLHKGGGAIVKSVSTWTYRPQDHNCKMDIDYYT
jgi:hypothetical protein